MPAFDAALTRDLAASLLPLPRHFAAAGQRRIAAADLTIETSADDLAQEAGDTLAAYVAEMTGIRPAGSGAADIAIGDAAGERAWPATGHQAYQIDTVHGCLDLAAPTADGLWAASRTLKQALRFDGTDVLLPLLTVRDAADLAERGFWDYFFPAPTRANSELYTFTTARQWQTLVDDLADVKINLMELLLTGEGILYQSARFPELVEPDVPAAKNDLVDTVMAHARRRGVHLWPTLVHPEHMRLLREHYPETRAVNPRGVQPYLLDALCCFSHPTTRRILAGVFLEVAERFAPEGICVWIPENLGHCACESCRDRWGFLRAYFDIFAEAAAKVRQRRPDFRLRFLASFMRYTDRTLALLPEGAELEYYECDRHGLYGFDVDKSLPAHVGAWARGGGRLVGCVSYRGVGLGHVPLPYFDNVREWVRLLAREGGWGVAGSLYSSPGVCWWNLLAMADAGWNGGGRDTAVFVRAALRREGGEDQLPVMIAISDAWYVYHRLNPPIVPGHLLGRIRRCQPLDYADACYIADGLEYRDLPELRAALDGLHVVADQADATRRPLHAVAVTALTALYHELAAYHVYGRQLWPDPEKGPWEDWIATLQDHARQARQALAALPALVAAVRSRFPEATNPPPVNVQSQLAALDEILAPDFPARLDAVAWPDINSFA